MYARYTTAQVKWAATVISLSEHTKVKHWVNPRNVTAQVAGELKTITYEIPLPKNGCCTRKRNARNVYWPEEGTQKRRRKDTGKGADGF